MRFEAICYSPDGREIDHSPYLEMEKIAAWLDRAIAKLSGKLGSIEVTVVE